MVRLHIAWRTVVPAQRPVRFQPRDPNDRRYRWAGLDRGVRLARAARLEPYVSVAHAPRWAVERPSRHGNWNPNPVELGYFAEALARRYSGARPGLPRVRYWQVWNEPNLNLYLEPQSAGPDGRPASPALYRRMVNAFARAVHRVSRNNFVIAGGQSPFTFEREDLRSTSPMVFMRELLCMSADPRPRRTCNEKVEFDAWAHHPYTSGNPTHEAARPDDVSLGDMPDMRALLTAAVRAGQIRSRRPVQFWVTEFSWDTSPPDTGGVPMRLHARWVAEALYRMWSSGVNVVTWFKVRDDPFGTGQPYHSGLFFQGQTFAAARPKPFVQAFRFPFVAFRERSGVLVWGRTPPGARGRVIVEQTFPAGWKRVAVLRPNRYGIFTRRLRIRSSTRDFLRAQLSTGGGRTFAFSLDPPPDRPGNPFGN